MFALFLALTSIASADSANFCKVLSTDLKSVKLQPCLERTWTVEGKSTKERDIYSTRWGNPQGKKILILGSIHGDELSSVSLAFRWLEFMDRVKPDSFLRNYDYKILPLVNPDGYFIRPRTRVNANGVDLNRNFRTKRWNTDAISYWKTRSKSDPRRNPGKEAGSEAETRLIEKIIDDYKPDFIISIHAPYGLIDHDGPVVFPKTGAPLKIQALGAFPGSLGQYAGVEKQIPVVTVELAASKTLPDQKVINDLLVFIMRAVK